MSNGRITLNMTIIDMVVAMSDGVPGAVVVLTRMAQRDLFPILHLDDMGIYGSDIWRCYKDVCGEDFDLLIEKIMDHSIQPALVGVP